MAGRPGSVAKVYVPERGDAVWLTLTPQAGHEQAGRRPAVVLSPKAYNRKVGLALFCPVTTQVKGYPFEVLLPVGMKLRGAVLADQLKSLDWRARRAEFMAALPTDITDEILARSRTLLD